MQLWWNPLICCELSPQAEIDLREIGDYIASDNLQRPTSFVSELLAQSRNRAEHISMGELAEVMQASLPYSPSS
jgi:plasmid stabilization system protein ParE